MKLPKRPIQSIAIDAAAGRKRYVTYMEGAELYSVSLHTFQKLANAAGAVRRLSRCKCLVNLDELNLFLEEKLGYEEKKWDTNDIGQITSENRSSQE